MRTVAKYLIAAALASLCAEPGARAAEYPSKPIKIIVGYGPGGVADISTRIIAQKLSASLGQQVIVDNKPGAGQIVATETAVRAKPDGYTLALLTNGQAISVALFKSLPYDFARDFAPISAMGFFQVAVLVDKKSPINTVKDLIAQAQANPGKLNFGGIGYSTQHLAAALFMTQADIKATFVPFKTTPDLITALNGNEIQVGFEMTPPVLGYVRDGMLKAVAVSSDKRFQGFPNVPTVKESGLTSYQVVAWNALAAPAKTPPEIIARLNKEVNAALAAPDVRKRFDDLGIEPRGGTPEEAKQILVSEIAKWPPVVKAANIQQQ